MLLLFHITHAALLCGGCKRDCLQHMEIQIPGGNSHALAPRDGAGTLGCTPQQLNRAQAQPSHHIHLAAAFQGTGRGIPPDGSSNSPSPHLSRITMNLPALPGLLLSKAPAVWQGFGERGAQAQETQLRGTRHIACHPSTYPTSPGQKKSRKKEKTNCKDESGPPDGLELLQLCESQRRRAARQPFVFSKQNPSG